MRWGNPGKKQRDMMFLKFRWEIQNNTKGAEGARNERIQNKVIFLPSPSLPKKALTALPLRIQMGDPVTEGVIWIWFCTLAGLARRPEALLSPPQPKPSPKCKSNRRHSAAYKLGSVSSFSIVKELSGQRQRKGEGQHWTTYSAEGSYPSECTSIWGIPKHKLPDLGISDGAPPSGGSRYCAVSCVPKFQILALVRYHMVSFQVNTLVPQHLQDQDQARETATVVEHVLSSSHFLTQLVLPSFSLPPPLATEAQCS